MKFYNNVTQMGSNMLFLWFTKDEATQLGPIGTRLGVFPTDNRSEFLLKPHYKSRARLHVCKKSKVTLEYEVAVRGIEGWPITGRTDLPYKQTPDGMILYPGRAQPTGPRHMNGGAERQHLQKRHVEQLPLDLPPPPPPPDNAQDAKPALIEAPHVDPAIRYLAECLSLLNESIGRLRNNGASVVMDEINGKIEATVSYKLT